MFSFHVFAENWRVMLVRNIKHLEENNACFSARKSVPAEPISGPIVLIKLLEAWLDGQSRAGAGPGVEGDSVQGTPWRSTQSAQPLCLPWTDQAACLLL